MRTSKYLLSTLKDIPTDAEGISHKLMLRAGMIRKLASGIYTWLPTGLRVLRKVEHIVREEMEKVGAIEISMPVVQPADMWQESGRLVQYGPELLRFTDRRARSLVLGPTYEEVITALIRKEILSDKQLPLNLFQINTKFRDEIRPRFGVMRSREFVMKDAYSFHSNQESLQLTYEAMYQAYIVIFKRIGLDVRAVSAGTGIIGGHSSHEFQVITASGEDSIVCSTVSDYAANLDLAEAVAPYTVRREPGEEMRLVDTPYPYTTSSLMQLLSIPIEKIVKTLIVRASENVGYPLVALIVRADHNLNEVKAEKLPQVAVPLTVASTDEIRIAIGVGPSSLGPINLPIPMIIDRSVAFMSDFTAGANIDGKHFCGINWERDVPLPHIADLRNVINGDLSPDGQGTLQIKRGIEVGHIFKLGSKYSETMKAMVACANGSYKPITMGCYGIGITRVVAAAIEQNHDHLGILWKENIAPFNVAIVPINMHNSNFVKKITYTIYSKIMESRIDVLLDDRKERPGLMFADMELIGIPHIIVVSDRNLNNKVIEYQNRRSGEKQIIKLSKIVDFLIKKISVNIEKYQ